MQPPLNGWSGASVALVAIFMPAFLMTIGSLPFCDIVRTRSRYQAALRAINAAVVGLLLGAPTIPSGRRPFTPRSISDLDSWPSGFWRSGSGLPGLSLCLLPLEQK